MAVPAIETVKLTKVYKGELGEKSTVGVDALDLTVSQGGVYAFIGPNGAGKTTTIKLLLRLMHPSAGEVRLLGESIKGRQALAKVGFLPEQPRLYGYLSGREFLDFVGRLFGLSSAERRSRAEALLERVGLKDRAGQLIRGYSRGMMQRLGLAQALMNDPQLVILDEPMASLDPVGRKDFRDLILDLKKAGKTVFFSSHILSDAEMIADRVGMLHRGRLIREGEMADLLGQRVEAVDVVFEIADDDLLALKLTASVCVRQGGRWLSCQPDTASANRLAVALINQNGRLISMTPRQPNLESLFIDEIGGAS